MKNTPTPLYRFLTGVILTIITAALYLWRKDIAPLDVKVINSVILVTIAHTLAAVSVDKLLSFPGKQSWLQILPAVGVAYSCVFGVFAVFFVTFSNSFVLVNGVITAIFFCMDFWWRSRQPAPIAYIPLGDAVDAYQLPHVQWLRLESPILPEQSIQAVVADLHSQDLNQDWQKFLAQSTLSNIPVYHIRQVEESLTGRVKITHMYENNLGSLLPSPAYMAVKRILDIILIIISLPITLPLMLLTALAIKIESSKDSVIFTQKRIGQYGKEFTIYKFRSMIRESEKDGAQFAQPNDTRITKIGHFLRKTRLDELPQFWNILKGEMSLVGPRPEQKVFVEQFEKIIPFYQYRHVVKPGLTGWAQVIQGYASDVEAIQIKLGYDLYYVKFFSLFLDCWIVFKTIKLLGLSFLLSFNLNGKVK